MEQKNQDKNTNKETSSRVSFFVLCTMAVIVCALLIGLIMTVVGGGDNPQKDEPKKAVVTEEPKQEKEPEKEEKKEEKETAEIPPAEEQNDLLEIAKNAHGFETKIAYLTFDDGPTTNVTPRVLDVLKEYNVKATFFMLGRMIDGNPQIARRVYDEGHLLANHSYNHTYKELYASEKSFMAEIKETERAIRDVTGEEPFKLVRFPGGSQNAGSYAAQKQEYKKVLQKEGYYFVDWNALNGDAEGENRSPAQLLSRMQQTATQPNIVILMHDAAAKRTTADALPSIIEYLRGQGYEFKRLDEIKYYSNEEKMAMTDLVL